MNSSGMKLLLTGAPQASRPWCRSILMAYCIVLIGMLAPARTGAQEANKAGKKTATARALIYGERMYRQGILPSGKPMVAIQGSASLPGTAFACASCHARSGLGNMEEGQRILPINAAYLFQPLYHFFPSLSPSEREALPAKFQSPPLRPAYTDATLRRAIRDGIDPNGRKFNPTMPKYALNAADMATLIQYLRKLSSKPSPGVTDTNLALATVITDDVREADRDAMLTALDGSVQSHNLLGSTPGIMGRTYSMRVEYLAFRNWSLAHWLLKGPPGTWRAQLENHYRAEPVFALVGGLSNNSWTPIHDFCEDHQIPCILPITDLPEISNSAYYSLYFSKGYYQEGQAVARYLAKNLDATRSWHLVQVLGAGPEAQALAAGFQNVWAGAAGKPVETLSIGPNQPLRRELLSRLLPPGTDSALMLWAGPDSYDLLRSLASAPNPPAFVFLSSTLLDRELWDLPSEARPFTYVSYPFREPGEKRLPPKMGRPRPVVVNKEYRTNDRRIASKTATVVTLLNDAIIGIERNFYRDYLLDVIDGMEVLDNTDYELLNFASGQRYLSEGCYIMRLSEGPNPMLIPVSGSDEQ